jgi:hypothetical protein
MVRLRNPDREVLVEGGCPVGTILDELGVSVDALAQILGERPRGAADEPSDRDVAEELADEVLPREIYDRASG